MAKFIGFECEVILGNPLYRLMYDGEDALVVNLRRIREIVDKLQFYEDLINESKRSNT